MDARDHPDLLDDAQLVVAAQEGDQRALDRLLRRHVDRLHAVCRRITGNDGDAADATQEALLALVRGLPRFDGRSSFSTWAYRVAANACLDELRRRRRRPEPMADEVLDWAAGGAGGAGANSTDAAADRVDIDRALAQLPLEFRVAVVLRDLSGLEYSEIAEVLGVPVGTVKSRIARGRGALANLLATGNPPPAPERPTSRP
ncbi:MAG: RNA polymerase sigma factor [Actinobacteria bacterium]|nr:RNA polymerase sigma factor [Actinomycetota bacterium]